MRKKKRGKVALVREWRGEGGHVVWGEGVGGVGGGMKDEGEDGG